jgi:hypothetical protein
LYRFSCSHPGHKEAIITHFLNPSRLEGVDALLVIGAGEVEDQLLLYFFLAELIFPDGDSMIYEDLIAHSKGWVLDKLEVPQDLQQSTETSWTFFISQEVFQGRHMEWSLSRQRCRTSYITALHM